MKSVSSGRGKKMERELTERGEGRDNDMRGEGRDRERRGEEVGRERRREEEERRGEERRGECQKSQHHSIQDQHNCLLIKNIASIMHQ